MTSAAGKPCLPPAVVVHAGARDGYQLAAALNEGGVLKTLVTNIYSARRARTMYGVDLSPAHVTTPLKSLASYLYMRLRPKTDLHGFSDRVLGETARAVALRAGVPLFAYSYYARYAFPERRIQSERRFLFQLHPHPRSVHRILLEERELVPDARESLDREWELKLGPADLTRLASEPLLADHICVASSFTKQTLIENGIDAEKISLVPYGVNTELYSPSPVSTKVAGPLRVVWVGSLVQRKGLSYALDAMGRFSPREVQFVVCGRGFADTELLRRHSLPNLEVKMGLSTSLVVEELRRADLFLLPSLVEGFGLSIIEAMSCGVPVITTAHTCGPDLITEGVDGFIVPVRNADRIVFTLEKVLKHRDMLKALGREARLTALRLTWEQFRREIRKVYISRLTDAA